MIQLKWFLNNEHRLRSGEKSIAITNVLREPASNGATRNAILIPRPLARFKRILWSDKKEICCDTSRQLINQLILSNSSSAADWCMESPGKFVYDTFCLGNTKSPEPMSLRPWFLLLRAFRLFDKAKRRRCCFAGIDCAAATACRFKNKSSCRLRP